MLKVLAAVAGVALLLALLVVGVAQTRWDRTFEAPFPEIASTDDPDVIEHGRYLVYGPMHCAYCHTPKSEWPAIDAGETPPLRGGYAIDIPPGRFHTPNLTPDPETGIGRRTDAELARVLRNGVRHDGRAAVPFMEYQDASDEDLVAVISFLRSQEPVRNEVPDHELRFLGKLVLATVLGPAGPNAAPPARAPAVAPTVERGAYVARTLAQCLSCHTERRQSDGAFVGPEFAGGGLFEHAEDPEVQIVSPNITFAPESGVVAGWTEDDFVQRFHSGVGLTGSPMPWGAFQRMAEEDLRAVYRFLASLEPVENDIGPIVRRPGG